MGLRIVLLAGWLLCFRFISGCKAELALDRTSTKGSDANAKPLGLTHSPSAGNPRLVVAGRDRAEVTGQQHSSMMKFLPSMLTN